MHVLQQRQLQQRPLHDDDDFDSSDDVDANDDDDDDDVAMPLVDAQPVARRSFVGRVLHLVPEHAAERSVMP